MGKGKEKAPAFLTDEAALAPFECRVRDIIETPLGVAATVVGVKDGTLWMEWPGGAISPASPGMRPEHEKSAEPKSKAELETAGYRVRGTLQGQPHQQSSIIQRAIDERARDRVKRDRYGLGRPPLPVIRLPVPSQSS